MHHTYDNRSRRTLSHMASMRSYQDGCAAAHALDLVGDRWALLIVRELLLGPKRFTDLRAGLPRASPNVLSQRLRQLEDAGVLRHSTLPPPVGSPVYSLTAWGAQLEETVMALTRWGVQSPDMPFDTAIGTDAVIIALRAMADPSRVTERLSVQFVLGEDRFALTAAPFDFQAHRAVLDEPQATVHSDPETVKRVMLGGHPVSDAEQAGALTIDGDHSAVRKLVDVFALPTPTGTAS